MESAELDFELRPVSHTFILPLCLDLFCDIPTRYATSESRGGKALKNEQKRQKCGYLRATSLFADVGRSGSKGSHMGQSHLAGIRKCVRDPPLKNRPRRHIPCWVQCCSRHEHE